MTRRPATMMRPGQVLLRLAAILLVALSANAPLLATTAKDLYTAALTLERELRAPANTPPTLTKLRMPSQRIRRSSASTRGAGTATTRCGKPRGWPIQAFDRHRQPADRDAGVEFLQLLKHEYPSSSLVSRVADRLEQLRRLDEPAQIRAVHREPLADVVPCNDRARRRSPLPRRAAGRTGETILRLSVAPMRHPRCETPRWRSMTVTSSAKFISAVTPDRSRA